MLQVFSTMPLQQKVDFANYILDIGFEINMRLRPTLCEHPYACAFVIELSTAESFRELDDIDGYKVYNEAVD